MNNVAVQIDNGIEPVENDLLKKAVCLSVNFSKMGNSRKVPSGAVEVDADKTMIHVSKTLIDSDELQAIERHDGEMKRYLASRCLPSLFKQGIYLLPVALIDEVDGKITEFLAERKKLVDAFIAVYPERVEAAAKRLNVLYDPLNYPGSEQVKAEFGVSVQYINFGVPGQLKQVSRAIFNREKDKAERLWKQATEEVQQVLRAAMADLVNHMVDRLSANHDGKKRVFRNSLVVNMADFLQTFEARNIADDKELKTLVGKAKDILKGADLLTLKTEADFLEFNRSYKTRYYEEDGARIEGLITMRGIDWPRLAREYDGIEIPSYLWQFRLHPGFLWFYGWDVASGCIWTVRDVELKCAKKK